MRRRTTRWKHVEIPWYRKETNLPSMFRNDYRESRKKHATIKYHTIKLSYVRAPCTAHGWKTGPMYIEVTIWSCHPITLTPCVCLCRTNRCLCDACSRAFFMWKHVQSARMHFQRVCTSWMKLLCFNLLCAAGAHHPDNPSAKSYPAMTQSTKKVNIKSTLQN